MNAAMTEAEDYRRALVQTVKVEGHCRLYLEVFDTVFPYEETEEYDTLLALVRETRPDLIDSPFFRGLSLGRGAQLHQLQTLCSEYEFQWKFEAERPAIVIWEP